MANSSGVIYTVSMQGHKALKSATTIIGEVVSKVNTTGTDGYKPLAYLGTAGSIGYNIRMDAQAEMCRAFRAARVFDLVRAALYGHLVLVDTKSSDTEPTAMFDARITELVQSLICLSERWAKCRPTKLHHEMAPPNSTSSMVVQCLSPGLFPDLNESLFNLVRDLLPSAFFRKLEDRLFALRSRTMNAFQLVVEVFEDDRTLPSLAAADDRKDLAANLDKKWTKGNLPLSFVAHTTRVSSNTMAIPTSNGLLVALRGT